MNAEKKAFILKAHKEVACEEYKAGIERHWPNLFEEQYKVGDYVFIIYVGFGINSNIQPNTIERIKSITSKDPRGGLSKYDKYVVFNSGNVGEYNSMLRDVRPATVEEVETWVINEAKEKGYALDGSNFRPIRGRGIKGYNGEWCYTPVTDCLWTHYSGGNCIYEKGVWAQLLMPKDLHELITKYGVDKIKQWL